MFSYDAIEARISSVGVGPCTNLGFAQAAKSAIARSASSAAAERNPKGAGANHRALCAEAIRLERVLTRLMPDDGEVWGLLALILLHHARRDLLKRPMMGRGSQ